MKNIDVKQLGVFGQVILKKLQRYSTFIFIISVLFIYTFLVFRISVLSRAEVDESAVAEKANTIKRLKLDQASIDKIQQLQDQNVDVKSLFENARDNPF